MLNLFPTNRYNGLPFIPLDEELSLNISIMVLIISAFGKNTKETLILDINKLQIFLYLVKNPARIAEILKCAGKTYTGLDIKQTFTIKSLSSNVDILYDNDRVKFLIKKLAASGLLLASKTEDNSTKLYLSEMGLKFAEGLDAVYFLTVRELIEVLAPLKSLPASKLNSLLNKVFGGEQ